MLVSFIVRLSEDAASAGAVLGEVQIVATGERCPVTSTEELLAVLLRDQD